MSDADEHGSDEAADARPEEERPERPSRARTLMTPAQLTGLGALWDESRFPSTRQREVLGASIGLTSRKVQVWFQNQRSKHRRMESERLNPVNAPSADRASYSSPMFGPPYSTRIPYDLSHPHPHGPSSSSSGPSSSTYMPHPSHPGWGPPVSSSSLHPGESGSSVRHPPYHPNPPEPFYPPTSSATYPLARARSWEREQDLAASSSSAGSTWERARLASGELPPPPRPRGQDHRLDRVEWATPTSVGESRVMIGRGVPPPPPTVPAASGSRWPPLAGSSERERTRLFPEEQQRRRSPGPTPPGNTSPSSSHHYSPSSGSSSPGQQQSAISLPSFREFLLASTDELADPAHTPRSSAFPTYLSAVSSSQPPPTTFGSSYSSSASSSSSLKRKQAEEDDRPLSSGFRTSPSGPLSALSLHPTPPSSFPSRPRSSSYLSQRPLSTSYGRYPAPFLARSVSSHEHPQIRRAATPPPLAAGSEDHRSSEWAEKSGEAGRQEGRTSRPRSPSDEQRSATIRGR